MTEHKGKVSQVIGPVVDVAFTGELPMIYTGLEVYRESGGKKHKIVLEVQQQLEGNSVRTVAMDSTDGLARGMDVISTGKPISVPVGKSTLGRMFNLLGEPL